MDYVQRTMRGTVALPNGIRSTAVTIPFTSTVTVRGTDQLLFLPTALSTYLRITSNWASPSFTGAPLPTETHLSKTGFEASWNVASQFVLRQEWGDISEYGLFQASPFGVWLFQSVDVYTLTARAVKYAVLFIALTFLLFFLVERMNGIRVHPFQYILVGAGIGLFYLLLLSLAEHVGFVAAYAISSLAIIGLVTSYCSQILRERKFALLVGGMLVLLYLYLFLLLQMEDYALLFGAVMLFCILAGVMFVTRKIDWYGEEKGSA